MTSQTIAYLAEFRVPTQLIREDADNPAIPAANYYVVGDPADPLATVALCYSRSEFKRLRKAGAIKIGRPHYKQTWVKIGKQLFIVSPEPHSPVAEAAQIYWEYHNTLMPKVIAWETVV